MINFYQSVFIFISVLISFCNSQFFKEKYEHVPSTLPDEQLSSLLSNIDINDFKQILKPILVERVPGTESHANVRNFITESMEGLGWSVEQQTFLDYTPYGQRNFTNIIAKLNPKAKRFLTIAAHYDSKYFPNEVFIGATDSAVPCAMMIYMAKTLKDRLLELNSSDVSLMFLFFDGEEAFYLWSMMDSLYGARYLANYWAATPYPDKSSNTTELDRIDVLVLLDLIGASNPKFYSYFQKTYPLYQRLTQIEDRLTNLKFTHKKYKQARYFLPKSSYAGIQDDHVPFYQKGVKIVHVIASPFPEVWHTLQDDENHLDFECILELIYVFNTFTFEYLHDESSSDKSGQTSVYIGSLYLILSAIAVNLFH